jgi:hypothetical protein
MAFERILVRFESWFTTDCRPLTDVAALTAETPTAADNSVLVTLPVPPTT